MRLEGWHIIIMIGLLLMLAVVVGVVLMIAATRRARSARVPAGAGTSRADQGSGSKEQRLGELDDLLRRGVIEEDEYRAARARILDS
ncbi:SHOCT domain-containing protein [Arthrobacter sp. Soc17.1.1.1]|uniref:SHOCT domain-containing protein n=1 Tax=Arthrobacter sp. Soc17.1.1.1 TaxID=3121277 RepID=UPI002FE4B6CB